MTTALMTAEELLLLNTPGKCTELVRGQLVVREPPGFAHGVIVMRIGRLISLDPIRRTARVYRADGSESFASIDDSLDGEEVLPGFSLPLDRVL